MKVLNVENLSIKKNKLRNAYLEMKAELGHFTIGL